MLKEFRNTYQLTFSHGNEDTTVYADIPYSNASMAVFKIFSPNLWYTSRTYIMSWYKKQCWIIDPFDQISAFFDLPLDIQKCVEELIDKEFERDVAEEMAHVIKLVHREVNKDPFPVEDDSDELPF